MKRSFIMATSVVTMPPPHPAAVALLTEWNELCNLAGHSNVPAAPVSEASLIADLAAPCKIIAILQRTQIFFQIDQDKQTNHTYGSLAGQTPEALAQIIVDLSGMIDLNCKPTVEQLMQDDIVAKFELYLDILKDVRGIIEPAIVVNPQASMVNADASMAESAASDSTVRYHDIGPDVQPGAAGAPMCATPTSQKAQAPSATPPRSHAQGRPMAGTPGRHAAGAGSHPPSCALPPPSAARATRAQTAKKEAQQVQQTNAAADDGTAVAPVQGVIGGLFNVVGSLFSPAPQPRASVAREPARPAPAPVEYGDLFAEVKNDNARLRGELRDVKAEVARLKAVCDAKDSLRMSVESELQAAQAGEAQATAQLQAQKEAYAALEEQKSVEASAREVEALGYQDQLMTLRDEVAQGKAALTAALVAAQQEKEEAVAQAKAEAAQALEAAMQAQAAVLQEREGYITCLEQEVQAARDSMAAMQESMAAAAAERDAMSSSLHEARTDVAASLATAAAEVAKLRHECDAMRLAVTTTSTAYAADMTALGAQLNRAVAAAQKQAEEANSRFAREQSERRRLWNRVQELRGNIRVFVRVRPLLGKEAEEGAVVRVPTPYEVAVAEVAGDGLSGRVASKVGHALEFDRVFSPEEGQAAVYEEVQPLVTSAMDGYHATVFAYGQTGAGKSFTMEGPTGVAGQATEGDLGVYARSLRDLFAIAAVRKGDGWTYTIRASMVEIYNERVRDLLAAGTGGGALVLPSASDTSMMMMEGEREEGVEDALNNTASNLDTTSTTTAAMAGKEVDPSNLQIRPTSSTGSGSSVSLVGATWVEVSTAGDVAAVMAKGHAARFVRATNMNEHSSRSHCLLMVTINGSYTSPEGKAESVAGKLTLVDLAGSERLDKSGAEGQAKTEAANINTSLFWLGNVLHRLGEVVAAAPGERERMKVPYKESKLTHLLKDSLDRQGKVAMIAQVSPVVTSRSETVSTLQFAAKVKRVELGKAVKVSAPSATSSAAGAAGAGGVGAPGGVSSAELAKVRAEAKKEKERADKAEAEAAAAAARAEALAARVSSLESAAPAPLPEAVLAAKVQSAVDAAVKKAAEEGASKTKAAVDAALRRAVGEAEEKYKGEVASLKRALTSAQAKHEAEVETVRRETRMAVEREHKRKSMAPGAGATAAVPSTKAVKAGATKSAAGKGISIAAASGAGAANTAAPPALLPLSAGSTISSALPSLPSFVGFAALQEEQEEDVDAAVGCDSVVKEEEAAEAVPADSMPPAPSASEASVTGDGSLPSVACSGTSSSLMPEQEAGGRGGDEVQVSGMISMDLHTLEVPAAPEVAALDQTVPVQADSHAGDAVPAEELKAEEVAPEDAGGGWGRGSAVGLPSTGQEVQGAYVTPPAAGMPTATASAAAAAATVTPVAAPSQRTPGAAGRAGAGHTPAAAGGAGKRTPGLGGPLPGLKVAAAAAAAISARLASGGKSSSSSSSSSSSRGAGKGTPYKGGKAVLMGAAKAEAEEEEEGDGGQVEEDDSTSASHATPAHVKDKSLLPRHRAAIAGVPTPQPVGILKRSRAAQAQASATPAATSAAEGPATKTRKTGAAGGGRVAIKAPGDEAPTDTSGRVPGLAAAVAPPAVPVVPLPPVPTASPFPTPPAPLVYAKSMGVAVLPGAHSSFGRQPGVPLGIGMGLLPLGMVGQGHAGAAPSLQTLMGLHTTPQAGTAGTSTAEVSAALLYTSQAAGHAGSKRPGVPLMAVPAAAPLKMSRPALAPSTSGGATRVRVDENTAPASSTAGGKAQATGQASKAKGSAGPLMAKK